MVIFSYLLYYLIILPISKLPFGILYGISDFLYLVMYKMIGYRKAVVLGNIRRSFPEKSTKEHHEICDKFYHHFCDLIVESLKVFSISEKQVKERMVFTNPEIINKYFDQGRSVILAGGHFNNWELFAVAVDAAIKHETIAFYKPLSNKFFDEKMRLTRGKYGLQMISTKNVKQCFEESKSKLTVTIFGADQSPSNPKNCHWMTFLNQDTGVLWGTERYAKELDYPVIYGRIVKVKRGHYQFEFMDLCEHPKDTKVGEITELHTKALEQDIIAAPEFWLWSHRRWKLKKPADAI